LLRRPAVHQERVAILLHRGGGLLGHQRLLEDVVELHHATSCRPRAPSGLTRASLPVCEDGPVSHASRSPFSITRYRLLSISKQVSWSARQSVTSSMLRALRRALRLRAGSFERATRAVRSTPSALRKSLNAFVFG